MQSYQHNSLNINMLKFCHVLSIFLVILVAPSPVPVTRSESCVVSYLKSALIENPVGVSTSSPSKSLAEDSDATEFFFY